MSTARMFLTDDEIRELTGRQRRPAQVKVLNRLGGPRGKAAPYGGETPYGA